MFGALNSASRHAATDGTRAALGTGMNKKSSKKLSLDAQTVRALSGSQLADVGGGIYGAPSWWNCSSGCGSGVAGCSIYCNSQANLTCPK